MKDYIIILLILFGVSTRISAQKSTSIEFIQKGVEYAQKENCRQENEEKTYL